MIFGVFPFFVQISKVIIATFSVARTIRFLLCRYMLLHMKAYFFTCVLYVHVL